MTDILYRTDSADRFRELPAETFKDIALSEVIGFMASDQEDQGILKDIMTKIPTDISDMKLIIFFILLNIIFKFIFL